MSAGNEWEQPPEPEPFAYGVRPRGGAVTASGVFSIVLGAVEILYCGLAMVTGAAFFGAGGGEALKAELEKQGANPADIQKASGMFGIIAGLLIVVVIIGILIGVLRILAGVGTLNRKSWGRTMTIVMASITIVFALFSLFGIMTIQGALFFLAYTAYVIVSFVILLNQQNAAEFRTGGSRY
jgi:hypothetical protein